MTQPGGFTAGDVLTAADMNGLPGGVVVANDQSGELTLTSSYQDIPDLSVTFTVVAGRAYEVQAYLRYRLNATGDNRCDGIDYQLCDGAATVQYQIATGSGAREEVQHQLVLLHNFGVWASATPGTATLKIRARTVGGADTWVATTSANSPSWLMVKDIGLAP
jgi:hypothetical protein